jgi:hypothetical protein
VGRGRRRNDAVETPVTNKAQCIVHQAVPTLPQPEPNTDDIMRALFVGPRHDCHSAKETK